MGFMLSNSKETSWPSCFFFNLMFVVCSKCCIFAKKVVNINEFEIMRTGDKVLISPDLTHAKVWTCGEVIEVENNPFVGIVISAKTEDGNVFFGYKDLFEPAKEETCTH